jgi:hypothetical protein
MTISAGAGMVGLDRIDILASSSASGIWIGSDVSPPVFGAVAWEDAVIEMLTGTL